MNLFDSKSGAALITGASSGIGREIATMLAAQNRPIVIVGRNAARLDETAATLEEELGVTVWPLAIDLARPGSAREVFDFTQETGIEVDLLINNAGVGVYGEHAELEPERLVAMLQLNITTLTELCLLYGAEMKRRGTGRILNIASTAGYQPTPWFAAYGASKAFVLNFSEALAMELGDFGVTVSCLSPGPTDTGFFGEMDAKGLSNAHFAKSDRHDARSVARIGVEMMMNGELSKIVGVKNFFRAFSGRLVPRSFVARFAKGIMRTDGASQKQLEAAPTTTTTSSAAS